MPAMDWLNPKEDARKPKPAPRPEKKRVSLRIFGAQSLDQGLGLTKKQPDKSRFVFKLIRMAPNYYVGIYHSPLLE